MRLLLACLRLYCPVSRYFRHVCVHTFTRLQSVESTGKQLVISGFCVANVREDGKPDRIFGQVLCGSGAANTAAVFPACVLSYRLLATRRTIGIERAHAGGKSAYVFLIEFASTNNLSGAPDFPLFGIRFTFFLCLLKTLVINKKALALVPLAGPAPLEDDSRKSGVSLGASG